MFDPSARFRRNPAQSAREFIESDPLVSRQNTLSGTFQPAETPPGTPISSAELSTVETLQDRLAEQEQQDQQQMEGVVRLAEQQRRKRMVEQQEQFGFGQSQAQTGSTGGFAGNRQTPDSYRVPEGVTGTRQQVLQSARGYLGSPYQLGGTTVRGVDCSGLVKAIYSQAGFDIQQHSATWQGRNIPGAKTAVANLQPGDLVAWRDGSHFAIYAGNGMIIDASSRRGTTYRKLWAPESAVYGIKLRFPGD
jgi:cell wall-associated NlpC family hydrolase